MLPAKKSNNIALKKRQSDNFLSPATAQLCTPSSLRPAEGTLGVHRQGPHAFGATLPC